MTPADSQFGQSRRSRPQATYPTVSCKLSLVGPLRYLNVVRSPDSFVAHNNE